MHNPWLVADLGADCRRQKCAVFYTFISYKNQWQSCEARRFFPHLAELNISYFVANSGTLTENYSTMV
jgi:hypothetical protein